MGILKMNFPSDFISKYFLKKKKKKKAIHFLWE